ncbi:MAG: lysozyme [Parvularculaceae bacterium]|nr:lysozyme [Parvularculaceae bacterium]
MKISDAGIELIKRFEGLELQSYRDIAGVWTIGYGHTETAGPDQRISESEAEDLLRRDLAARERAVDQLTSKPLNQNEFDALVSFVFNIGAQAFKNSTVRKRLNRGDRLGAADAISWWNKASIEGVLREIPGLIRRRAAERARFLTPVKPPIVRKPEELAENSRVTPIEDPPRRESLGDSRTIQGAAVAGGAGAAASTIGRDSADELNQVETNIEDGTGLTEKPPGAGGLGESAGAGATGENSSVHGPAPGQAAPGQTTHGPAKPDAKTPSETTSGETITGETTPSEITTGGTTTGTIAADDRPSKHEKHAVDAQLQFALFVIILLSALYVVFARIDDWMRYRR